MDDKLFNVLSELQKLGVHHRIEYDTAPEFGAGYRTLTPPVSLADTLWR